MRRAGHDRRPAQTPAAGVLLLGLTLAAASPPAAAAAPASRSYVIPALEIIGFDVLVNRFNRVVLDEDEYEVDLDTIARNLGREWTVEDDPFQTNQLGHPYQGSMYHGFARSTGFGFWGATAYAFAGSVMWEIAGENTTPSVNDQVATGIGGPFLGEALFRMASLVLETSRGLPGFWREVAAAAISPATGFNRLAFGPRFDDVFASRGAAYFARLQLGTGATTQNEPGTVTDLDRTEVLADVALDYGLPGQPGYRYRRPFDYFSFNLIGSSAGGFEQVSALGLLLGTDYAVGERYRGIWGLYGSFDYFEPQLFRISSTALMVGTTAQWWLSESLALQGTFAAGVGYAGARTAENVGEDDYHYGIAPQAVLGLRLLLGHRASLEFNARDYLITRLAAESGGHENVARADLTFTWRVHGRHGVALKYLWSRRDASYTDLDDRFQERGTLGLFYTFLGAEDFGAVEWR